MSDFIIDFKGSKSNADWCKFFNQTKSFQTGDKIAINLNSLDFLNSQEILYLFLVCQKIFKETNRLVTLHNISSSVHSYLERIDFFNYGAVKANKENANFLKFLRNRDSKSVIEITQISNPKKISVMMIKTRTILSNWYSDKKYVSDIINILMEICGNGVEHSSDKEGQGECFYLLQKFKSGRCGVSIAVGDVGIGIKAHLMKTHSFSKQTDSYYIVRAMQGLTGRSSGDGGMGFQVVQGIVKRFRGKITILSGNGVVCIENGNMEKWSRASSFLGTQCIIELPFL